MFQQQCQSPSRSQSQMSQIGTKSPSPQGVQYVSIHDAAEIWIRGVFDDN